MEDAVVRELRPRDSQPRPRPPFPQVSATSFTVIGILCKLGTLIVNRLIWDKHAGLKGSFFLLVCLAAGTFYQQAPMRADAKSSLGDAEEPALKAKLVVR